MKERATLPRDLQQQQLLFTNELESVDGFDSKMTEGMSGMSS